MQSVCFYIFGRPIYWYGIMIAAAFLACITHLSLLGRREGRSYAFVSDLGFLAMVSGIIGARIAYVLANLDYFNQDLTLIIRVDQGGLIYYGGFIGAALAAIIYARARRVPFRSFADFVITALPLGQAIGRIGCFLNGCCYGTPGTPPWSVVVDGVERHPTPLYETIFCMAIYGILLWYYRKRPRSGRVFALYLILYPMGRFLLEFWRGDERLHWLGMNAAQELSLVLLAAGILIWFLLPVKEDDRRQTTDGRPENTEKDNGRQTPKARRS
ncbi:MAG: prolipoprotein diacylglyceryl transferase [Kiritimatiellae bacterium]|nr:prolipoprotein diacylglyceryl transferase [Kiritimatiellia bacterium]